PAIWKENLSFRALRSLVVHHLPSVAGCSAAEMTAQRSRWAACAPRPGTSVSGSAARGESQRWASLKFYEAWCERTEFVAADFENGSFFGVRPAQPSELDLRTTEHQVKRSRFDDHAALYHTGRRSSGRSRMFPDLSRQFGRPHLSGGLPVAASSKAAHSTPN